MTNDFTLAFRCQCGTYAHAIGHKPVCPKCGAPWCAATKTIARPPIGDDWDGVAWEEAQDAEAKLAMLEKEA